MKKSMCLVFIVCSLFSLNSFAANGCTISGVAVVSGGQGCDGGFVANCNNGTVTFAANAQGDAISCGGAGGIAAPVKKIAPKQPVRLK